MKLNNKIQKLYEKIKGISIFDGSDCAYSSIYVDWLENELNKTYKIIKNINKFLDEDKPIEFDFTNQKDVNKYINMIEKAHKDAGESKLIFK